MQKWYLRTNEAIVPIKLVENCNRSRSWNWRSKSLFCEAIIELKDLATALNLHQFELSITGSSVISCPDSRCHHCTDTHTHTHTRRHSTARVRGPPRPPSRLRHHRKELRGAAGAAAALRENCNISGFEEEEGREKKYAKDGERDCISSPGWSARWTLE